MRRGHTAPLPESGCVTVGIQKAGSLRLRALLENRELFELCHRYRPANPHRLYSGVRIITIHIIGAWVREQDIRRPLN